MKKDDLFEEMVTNLTLNFMDEDFDIENANIPLPGRLAVLAEGFARNLTLEKVNERLEDEGYETLYARSFYEAGLIYAFSHQLSYDRWMELYQKYMEKYTEQAKSKKQSFPKGKITLKNLEKYVRQKRKEENLKNLIYHFRNAISHGHIEASMNKENEICKLSFRDVNPRNQDETFQIDIKVPVLRAFVLEFSESLIRSYGG